MQHHAMTRVTQQRVEVIGSPATCSLQGDVGKDRLRHTEQLHGLIQQVWAKVEPQSRSRLVLFAPAIHDLRAIPVEPPPLL